MIMNTLSQLAKMTTLVADTGDLPAIIRLKPIDATTNPSLITSAFISGEYDDIICNTKHLTTDEAIDYLTVWLGKLILEHITGRVSTEVDAKLSFDTQKTVTKALQFIDAYEKLGVKKERILIKIAATWQGIEAAKILEQQGIHCNLTLLFTQIQAQACADAGVTLISPFVGRITDWQKQHENKETIDIHDDLGVLSVKNIYHFYKKHGYTTEVMGASFRSCEQILALAGCDLLTISPTLLDELSNMDKPVIRMLSFDKKLENKPSVIDFDTFNQTQNHHPLNQLLLKGIDGFIQARDVLAEKLTRQ